METKDSLMIPGRAENDTAMAEAFAALGSPVRLAILRALVRAGPDGLVMGALGERVELPGSTLSHHVRAMVQAGLISQSRAGRSLICRAEIDRIEALATALVAECCADVDAGVRHAANR